MKTYSKLKLFTYFTLTLGVSQVSALQNLPDYKLGNEILCDKIKNGKVVGKIKSIEILEKTKKSKTFKEKANNRKNKYKEKSKDSKEKRRNLNKKISKKNRNNKINKKRKGNKENLNFDLPSKNELETVEIISNAVAYGNFGIDNKTTNSLGLIEISKEDLKNLIENHLKKLRLAIKENDYENKYIKKIYLFLTDNFFVETSIPKENTQIVLNDFASFNDELFDYTISEILYKLNKEKEMREQLELSKQMESNEDKVFMQQMRKEIKSLKNNQRILPILGLVRVDDKNSPMLHKFVTDVAKKSGLSKPMVLLQCDNIFRDTLNEKTFGIGKLIFDFFIDKNAIIEILLVKVNAFVIGMNIGGKSIGVISVCKELIEEMSKNELEAIISHELGHLKNNHMLIRVLLTHVLNKINESPKINEYLKKISTLIYFFISRLNEKQADLNACKTLSNPLHMKSALLKMDYIFRKKYKIPYFYNKIKNPDYSNRYLTHPTTKTRIKYIENYAKKVNNTDNSDNDYSNIEEILDLFINK